MYMTAIYGEVPIVDAVATHDATTGETAMFMVNRDQGAPTTVTIDVSHLGPVSIKEVTTLADDDIYAKNTLMEQERVTLRPNDSAKIVDGTLTITLPPVSWTAVALA
jgi:alpha-N-arabinofuranosidase